MSKFDVDQANEATLRELAGNALAWDECTDEKSCALHAARQTVLLQQLRTQCATKPLRTSAQVSADKLALATKFRASPAMMWHEFCEKWDTLCAEPVAVTPPAPQDATLRHVVTYAVNLIEAVSGRSTNTELALQALKKALL